VWLCIVNSPNAFYVTVLCKKITNSTRIQNRYANYHSAIRPRLYISVFSADFPNAPWKESSADASCPEKLGPLKGLNHLYNKRRYVCLSVCLFRIAGQTAGPIETKLDTRTHVHPGSFWQGQCQGHSRMPARVTEVRNTRKATPSERSAHYVRTPAAATPSERNYSNEARRLRRRAASGAAVSRTPSGGRVIRASTI